MKKVMFTVFAVGLGLTANVMAQVPSYVPSNGLVGWWPFNGNANDESGNGNNGTVNGATLTTDRFGNVGKAYSFDGGAQNIICNPVASAQSLTISTWLYVQNNGGGEFIIQNNSSNCTNVNFGGHFGFSQKINFAHNAINCASPGIDNSTLSSTDTAGYVGDWINVVQIIDVIGNTKIYLNNVLVDFTSNNPGYNFCPTAGSNLRFGGPWWNQDLQWFKGSLDDIGIWNRVLTDQEISDLYNANICYEYVTVTDTLVINTGITGYNPITYLNTLKIWPNPSNDHITIDAGNLATMNGYSIKIEDAQGQQVFQNAVNQQQFYVDITTWGGNGLYFVRIIDPQGNTVDIKKIVLQ